MYVRIGEGLGRLPTSYVYDSSSPLGLDDPQGPGTRKGDIDFEFDLNYGMEKTAPPNASRTNEIVDSKVINPTCRIIDPAAGTVEPKNLTVHEKKDAAGNIKDGFEVRQDGPRMEISTMRFALDGGGRAELSKTMANIMGFVSLLKAKCERASPITPPPAVERIEKPLGKLRYFAARGSTTVAGRPIFPLGNKTYFRSTCYVSAAPQATIDIPLAAGDELVTEIKKSMGKRPGVALTGWDRKKHRAGVRSDALFYAQKKVNESREAYLRKKIKLSDGTPVTKANFTANLQGFMILLVQYLRTSEIQYGRRDYEKFAKAYVPLLAKTHFRDMFHRILDPSERQVFMELYGNPGVRDKLYALAGRPRDGATRNLFPGPDKLWGRDLTHRERVQRRQDLYFSRRLTWDDLVQMTIDDTPLMVDGGSRLAECLLVSGTESLFTPLAKASRGPAKAGPKGVPGVRLELRRIGFAWVPSSRWRVLTDRIFELTSRLNGVT